MPKRGQRRGGTGRVAAFPSGALFFASRAANGALILAQVALVVRIYPSAQAARFFLFWTVVWSASVWLRFGFDQLLPKFAAQARMRGDRSRLGGYAQILRVTAPLLVLLGPCALAILVPGIAGWQLAAATVVLLVGAAAWATIYVLAALVKGYGWPGLSGVILGVVPAVLFTLVVPLTHAASGAWLALAAASSLALTIAAVIAVVLARMTVGRAEVDAALRAGWPDPRDADVLAAGLLQGISESSIWLPVWVGSALHLRPQVLAGLYAAIRASSAFSWGFASVVNVLTPRLAAGLTARDLGRVRELVLRSAALGMVITGPLALAGVLAASVLLDLMQPGYSAYTGVLIALIIARFVDAATGAVAEALILGDRAATELGNQIFAAVTITVLGLALQPSMGVLALGLACAIASVAANGLRVVEVSQLLRDGWPDRKGQAARSGARGGGGGGPGSLSPRAAARASTGPIVAVGCLFTLLWLLGIAVPQSSGRLLLFAWTAGLALTAAVLAAQAVIRLAGEEVSTALDTTPKRRARRALQRASLAGRRGRAAGASYLALARRALGEWRRIEARTSSTLAGLVLCAAAGWLVATHPGLPSSSLALLAGLGLIVLTIALTTIEVRRLYPTDRRQLVISPLSIAAAVWLITFVLRPLQLYLSPASGIYSLWQLGFGVDDIARTVGIAGIGCATWGAGYLLGVGHQPAGSRRNPEPARWPLSPGVACSLLALGSILWGALFLRQGGVSQLLNSPASIRKGQQSSGYGFIGIWLVQAVALYAWAALLNGGGRVARRLLIAATMLSLAGALCLQLRQLTVMMVLGSCLIYLRYRTPSRRAVILVVAMVVIGVPALAFASTFRNYTQFVSLRTSLSLTLHTPPTSFDSADLGTFDNMAVITKLVPNSVGWLGGSTLRAIPEALVPRSLWPGKPQPIDQQVTDLLLPGQIGGTPIMAQGELYWNLGLPAVALGMCALGLLMGLVTRLGVAARSSRGVLLYAVLVPATLTLTTRALATMTANLLLATIAASVAVWGLQAKPAGGAPGSFAERGRRFASSLTRRA